MKRILAIIFVIFLVSCAPKVNPASTETMIPTATVKPIPPTSTNIPTSTPKPTKTPTPIIYVTLGSPFAADCGDGIPRVWSNDAYNFTWYPNCNDDGHGHVDWFVPSGCDVDNYAGEVLSPVNGFASTYPDAQGNPLGVLIILDRNEYPLGILDALKFAGINPDLKKVTSVAIDLGHVDLIKSGQVKKWDSIGDVIRARNHYKIGYKVNVEYQGYGQITFSPNLFPNELQNGDILRPMLDGTSTNWICVPNSPYDCIPELKDYAPTCKFGK